MFKTDRYIQICKYVNLLYLFAIPFKHSSSRLRHSDRSSVTKEAMQCRLRNVDNAWADKLLPQFRRKDVSSWSDPIPSSKPLSVICSQLEITSSWSLQNISNITCYEAHNDSLIMAPLLVYWLCSVLIFWKTRYSFHRQNHLLHLINSPSFDISFNAIELAQFNTMIKWICKFVLFSSPIYLIICQLYTTGMENFLASLCVICIWSCLIIRSNVSNSQCCSTAWWISGLIYCFWNARFLLQLRTIQGRFPNWIKKM